MCLASLQQANFEIKWREAGCILVCVQFCVGLIVQALAVLAISHVFYPPQFYSLRELAQRAFVRTWHGIGIVQQ